MVIDIIVSVFMFLLGASLASFAGVVAFRAPKGQSIVKPDSYCPACKKDIKAYDNIPVISYILLGGKCRFCKSKIGAFGFICELLGGISFVAAYLVYGSSLQQLPELILICALIFLFLVIAGIDYETHDIYNITLIIYAVIVLLLSGYRVLFLDANIWDYVWGAVIGFGSFLLIQVIGKVILKKDAMGSGDIYLVGIGGALLGAFPWLLSILVATFVGSIIELTRIKMNKSDRESEIAFGPYLLLGICLMAIFGTIIMDFYWKVVL